MVDFHTHMFPDQIAPKTLEFLSGVSHVTPYTSATSGGLIESTVVSGLDYAVVLPVVTKPSQFRAINEFASHFTEGKLISFGGIHPDSEDYKGQLRQIQSYGLKGVKLHPDYQNTYFNDIKYKRIVEYASELGLVVSVHAGVDIGYPNPVHCTPAMALEVMEEVKPEKLVLAHMGGFGLWDEVEKLLVGKPVYFDTAYVFGHIDDEQFIRIVRAHGADKILFATDSPWALQGEYINYMEHLELTEDEKRQILSENANCLLGIKNEVQR